MTSRVYVSDLAETMDNAGNAVMRRCGVLRLAGAAGLYDFLYRELSPAQGRWLQPDPAGLAAVDPSNPQTWNRYAYVYNNPSIYVDNNGREPTLVTLGIGALAGAVFGGASELFKTGSWNDVGIGAACGLGGGAIAGASFFFSTAAGAAAATVCTNELEGQHVTFWDAVGAAIIGMVTADAGDGFANAFTGIEAGSAAAKTSVAFQALTNADGGALSTALDVATNDIQQWTDMVDMYSDSMVQSPGDLGWGWADQFTLDILEPDSGDGITYEMMTPTGYFYPVVTMPSASTAPIAAFPIGSISGSIGLSWLSGSSGTGGGGGGGSFCVSFDGGEPICTSGVTGGYIY